jgi:hypothetical protein
MAEMIKVCATESFKRSGEVDRILQDIYEFLSRDLIEMVARVPRELALPLASTAVYLLYRECLNLLTRSMSAQPPGNTLSILSDWVTVLPVPARVVAHG